MIREELGRLTTWEERHRRLFARIVLAIGLTFLLDLVAGVVIWQYESGISGSDIHGYGDALFFTSAQLLTVSSSLRNPGGTSLASMMLLFWRKGEPLNSGTSTDWRKPLFRLKQ